MNKKKVISFLSVILFVVLTYMGFVVNVMAADLKDVVVEGGYRFLLYYTNAIQGYAVDGDEIYIQQAYSENLFDEFDDYKTGRIENLALISRCRYSDEYDAYQPVDHMLLRGVGHGQTLEVYKHKGKKYLLVSCGSRPTSKKTLWWSTQIGRIEYKPGAVMNNRQIKKLTYLNYSNKKSKRFGTTMRVDASLTPDKKTLVIWKLNEHDKSEYAAYKFSEVNKAFDKVKGKDVNVKDNKIIKKAIIFSTKLYKLKARSLQGFALSNKINGKYNLFVSSGDEGVYKISGISIYKYEIKGGKIRYKSSVRLNADYVWSSFPPDDDDESEGISDEEEDYTDDDYTDEDEDEDAALAEIEDLKLEGGDLQFVVRNIRDSNQQLICTIPQSEF